MRRLFEVCDEVLYHAVLGLVTVMLFGLVAALASCPWLALRQLFE